MPQYRITLSSKIFLQENIRAKNIEEARQEAIEKFDGMKTLPEDIADILPQDNFHWTLEDVEPIED